MVSLDSTRTLILIWNLGCCWASAGAKAVQQASAIAILEIVISGLSVAAVDDQSGGTTPPSRTAGSMGRSNRYKQYDLTQTLDEGFTDVHPLVGLNDPIVKPSPDNQVVLDFKETENTLCLGDLFYDKSRAVAWFGA